MATLATLVVRLTADAAQFEKTIDGAQSKMASVSKGLLKTGGLMTAGVTAPLIGAGVAAVNAASDLEEAGNAARVVFGDAAEDVIAFSTTASTSTGLAQSDFLQMGSEVGAMLQNLGLSQDEAGAASIQLGQRAADMASIFNTDVSQAMTAIQAGLRGEADPLEKFGVNLKQSQIAAYAMSEGIADTTVNIAELQGAQVRARDAQEEWNQAVAAHGERSDEAILAFESYSKAQEKVEEISAGVTEQLTTEQRAQAALGLLMQQTDRISGDFANTSEGLANSQRIAKAQLKDIAATLGKELLPYVNQGVKFLRDLLTRFQQLNPEQRRTIVIVAAVAAALGPLLLILGAISGAIAAISAPVLIVAGVIAGLVAIWMTDFLGIRTFMESFWNETLKPIFQALGSWLQEKIPVAIQVLTTWWNNLKTAFTIVWNFISKVLLPILGAIAQVVGAVLGKAVEILAGIWENVLAPALSNVWEWFNDKIMPVLEDVWEWVKDKVGPILEWFNEKVLTPLKTGLGGIVDVAEKVVGWLKDLADTIANLDISKILPFIGGSPAPLAVGLRSISSAMKDLNGQMPEFNANLQAAPSVRQGDMSVTVYSQGRMDERDLRDQIQRMRLIQGAG